MGTPVSEQKKMSLPFGATTGKDGTARGANSANKSLSSYASDRPPSGGGRNGGGGYRTPPRAPSAATASYASNNRRLSRDDMAMDGDDADNGSGYGNGNGGHGPAHSVPYALRATNDRRSREAAAQHHAQWQLTQSAARQREADTAARSRSRSDASMNSNGDGDYGDDHSSSGAMDDGEDRPAVLTARPRARHAPTRDFNAYYRDWPIDRVHEEFATVASTIDLYESAGDDVDDDLYPRREALLRIVRLAQPRTPSRATARSPLTTTAPPPPPPPPPPHVRSAVLTAASDTLSGQLRPHVLHAPLAATPATAAHIAPRSSPHDSVAVAAPARAPPAAVATIPSLRSTFTDPNTRDAAVSPRGEGKYKGSAPSPRELPTNGAVAPVADAVNNAPSESKAIAHSPHPTAAAVLSPRDVDNREFIDAHVANGRKRKNHQSVAQRARAALAATVARGAEAPPRPVRTVYELGYAPVHRNVVASPLPAVAYPRAERIRLDEPILMRTLTITMHMMQYRRGIAISDMKRRGVPPGADGVYTVTKEIMAALYTTRLHSIEAHRQHDAVLCADPSLTALGLKCAGAGDCSFHGAVIIKGTVMVHALWPAGSDDTERDRLEAARNAITAAAEPRTVAVINRTVRSETKDGVMRVLLPYYGYYVIAPNQTMINSPESPEMVLSQMKWTGPMRSAMVGGTNRRRRIIRPFSAPSAAAVKDFVQRSTAQQVIIVKAVKPQFNGCYKCCANHSPSGCTAVKCENCGEAHLFTRGFTSCRFGAAMACRYCKDKPHTGDKSHSWMVCPYRDRFAVSHELSRFSSSPPAAPPNPEWKAPLAFAAPHRTAAAPIAGSYAAVAASSNGMGRGNSARALASDESERRREESDWRRNDDNRRRDERLDLMMTAIRQLTDRLDALCKTIPQLVSDALERAAMDRSEDKVAVVASAPVANAVAPNASNANAAMTPPVSPVAAHSAVAVLASSPAAVSPGRAASPSRDAAAAPTTSRATAPASPMRPTGAIIHRRCY